MQRKPLTERQSPPTIAPRANAAGRANVTYQICAQVLYACKVPHSTTPHLNGVRRVAGDTSEGGGLLRAILL